MSCALCAFGSTLLTPRVDNASPDDPNELSFSKGEFLDIVDNSGKWWQAKKADGTTGSEYRPGLWPGFDLFAASRAIKLSTNRVESAMVVLRHATLETSTPKRTAAPARCVRDDSYPHDDLLHLPPVLFPPFDKPQTTNTVWIVFCLLTHFPPPTDRVGCRCLGAG